MIVGKINLQPEENTFKLRSDIERLLRSTWLDFKTAEEFDNELKKRRDPLSLVNLRNQIEIEIKARKNRYSI